MQKEDLNKNCIDLSPFINTLYIVKEKLEEIIIEMEKIKNVQ